MCNVYYLGFSNYLIQSTCRKLGKSVTGSNYGEPCKLTSHGQLLYIDQLCTVHGFKPMPLNPPRINGKVNG